MKIWGSDHQMSGVPDIIGCYRGQFIAVETKMPGNTTSPRQDYVINKLCEAGARVVVAYSVAEALEVLAGEVTPGDPQQALTARLRAPSGAARARASASRPRKAAADAPELSAPRRRKCLPGLPTNHLCTYEGCPPVKNVLDESQGGDFTYG